LVSDYAPYGHFPESAERKIKGNFKTEIVGGKDINPKGKDSKNEEY